MDLGSRTFPDEGSGGGGVSHPRLLVLQGEHGFHVDGRLTQLAIDTSDEVERDGELEEETVHEDEVSNRGTS